MQTTAKLREKCQSVEEEEDELLEEAWDDVSGAAFKPEEVKRVRREEIECVHKMKLCD